MPRKSTRIPSEDESDPSLIALEAPKRIHELKKERDERAAAIVAEAEKELAALRQQAQDFQEERRREGSERRAQDLIRVRNLIEKRTEIETKMLEVVRDAHSAMQEVENMILAGYEGRRGEARQSLEALSGRPSHSKG
ncbi:hypothetical protein E4U13_002329 [Claviceps humidiphila]|uniref:Uncharacterized protein n=2 Tax=Claviceps TaxID=5110 RepID=A0A9P7TYI2_9HYPO|nr:hypothetical protein E4U56_002262 [Claviceps arundinis]KAG6059257.1 hypothetical protein E4U32_004144 [Claviceps aff. humidiphila group G2b]KAG6123700.1 hypothetical protein E4U13_002329 [Claviceps humidiphila]